MFDPISLLIQAAVFLVSTIVSSIVGALRQQDKKQVPGVRGQRQVGGTNPLSFIVGTYGTAGLFEYGNEWGDVDGVPRAYRSEVFSHSDLPIKGTTGRFINGRPVTLGPVVNAQLGPPVLEFRTSDGKDHMWWKDYRGVQTVADPLLLAKFGADPERPWQADMVFTGVAYSIITSLVNRELLTNVPDPMFGNEGIALYDVRKDSSAGGAGAHRLNNPATWEWTDSPIVVIYNILLGIRYQGEFVWVGKTLLNIICLTPIGQRR